LDHVLFYYCSTCLFLIWPRLTMLFVHVSYFYTSTWLDDFLPRVRFLIAHVSCSSQFTCHALVGLRVAFLFDHVACPSSITCRTNYIRKVIRDRHYYTDWQHNYSASNQIPTINISHVSKPLTESHHNKPSHESTQQTTNVHRIKP
jgi:hypothetical protein